VRILHLTAGNLFGGIETYLVTLARHRHLVPHMEPHFGHCYSGRLRDELITAGVSTRDLGPVRLSRPWTTWHARRKLKALLRENQYDTVLTHGSWPHAVFAPAVRRTGVRLVKVIHDDLSRPTWLDRQAARTPPDLIIANSHFTAKTVADFYPTVGVEVVYLPVAEPSKSDGAIVRREVRNAIGTNPDTVVILQASRLEERKGQAVFLDALARLSAVSDWEAWIAGGPQKPGEESYLSALRKKVELAGIGDRIRFLGQRTDVQSLMAAADVYCQPNIGPESFGLAFVEALHAGLPVVTSGFGGAREIVDESCGVLIPPGDVSALAAALSGLIRAPERRAKLGANGPLRAIELCEPRAQLSKLAANLALTQATKRRGHEAIA
jgi:glycosyltransferase involved in cell wall biosynthesis